MSTTASSWHYSPSHSGIADFSPLLKKYSYQLSFTGNEFNNKISIQILFDDFVIVPTAGTSGVDENTNTKSPAKIKGRDVWQQLGISDSQLLEYNEQFRLWLSSTVLQPLVAEIQRINESLTAHGLADARIGNFLLYFFPPYKSKEKNIFFLHFNRRIKFGEITQNLPTCPCSCQYSFSCRGITLFRDDFSSRLPCPLSQWYRT